MRKTVLVFGLLSGAVSSAMMLLTVPFMDRLGFGPRSVVVGYTAIVASFLLVYFGIRSYRDRVAGGSLTFGRAFTVGILISLLSSACYVATWELVYFKLKPDFLDQYSAYAVERARQSGASRAGDRGDGAPDGGVQDDVSESVGQHRVHVHRAVSDWSRRDADFSRGAATDRVNRDAASLRAPGVAVLLVSAGLSTTRCLSAASDWNTPSRRFDSAPSRSSASPRSSSAQTRRERIDIATIVWLIRGGGRNILFDTGYHRPDARVRSVQDDRLHPSRRSGQARRGRARGQITDVVISHVHWDHMGGIDLFPAATIWIQRDEYDYYMGRSWQPGESRAADLDDLRTLLQQNERARSASSLGTIARFSQASARTPERAIRSRRSTCASRGRRPLSSPRTTAISTAISKPTRRLRKRFHRMSGRGMWPRFIAW